MQVSEIRVTKSFTRNLGNYESTRVDYGVTVTLDEEDSPEEVRAIAKANVERWVQEDVNEIDSDSRR